MAEVKFGTGQEDFRQAEWLAEKMEHEWRYDHTAGRWHHWNGYRWAPDETNQVTHRVAVLAARKLTDGTGDETLRKSLVKLLSLGPAGKALDALATFPGYGTNGDDWDSIPYLLGVANGIVDLRENALVPAQSDMLVTKTTGVPFSPTTKPSEFDKLAPTFWRVMHEWMSDDGSMVAFLLMWFGASLFGMSPEQRFLLMTGIGRNGKGALKAAIRAATGEYSEQFDANLYMRSKHGAARSDSARADLLALKGKRITFFSEPEGNRFNEEMLKAHTGGDVITARALYSNNVQTWEPTHSITFLVNDPPEVDDLGPSMASRVMVADFRERFDGLREDKKLYGKLEDEAPGILAILCWAARQWHEQWSAEGGLVLPDRVVEQSRKFMERGDVVGNWLNDACIMGAELQTAGQPAYDAFKDWFRDSGQDGDVPSSVKWSATLEKKGFKRYRDMQSRGWKGFKPLGAMALAEKEGDEGAE